MVGPIRRATFTRRAIVQALPSAALLPLASPVNASGRPSVDSSPSTAEPIGDRIARLSRELSIALNEVDGGMWFASVFPSDYVEDPVRYGDIAEANEAVNTVSQALADVIVSLCAAYAELAQIARQTDFVACGRLPSSEDLRRLDEVSETERDLFMTLCRYRARNDPERHDKAAYLLGISKDDEFSTDHVLAILESMTSALPPVRPTMQRSNDLDDRA
ncbi:hypothetical protein [Mesorhizobium sp.]|uniref:hypothetical protein n=1 Tax=Mesorhizobium sp. TaxID=1871066 RepID=UPI00120F8816|nr:hypothetical protein [Mesorhizobium sp.]TIM05496.1 MAG: hypothetical protein E5Y62_27270 [Mesorhizobium sp.]